MNHRLSRRTAGVVATVLLAGAGVAVAPLDAEAASSTCSTSDGVTVCTFIDSTTVRSFDRTFETDFVNTKSTAATGKCTSNQSETNTYSVSTTVSAEAKAWIFAKISASVTGGVSHSVTASYGSEYTFTVPARSTVTCQYGIYDYSVRGHTTTSVHGSSTTRSWTAVAPKKAVWFI